jgi:DNA (cytosine-5)-methyltransferase 1
MREGARLQTFPDDFQFGSTYKKYVTSQIGNAVPPKLAYHVGVAVHRHLEGLEVSDPGESEQEGLRPAPFVDWETLNPAPRAASSD